MQALCFVSKKSPFYYGISNAEETLAHWQPDLT